MNNGKRLQSSAAVLLIAVLTIMAFVRGEQQIWLLAGAFTLWGLWMVIPILIYTQRKSQLKRPKKKASQTQNVRREIYDFDHEKISDDVLLRHVNYRISAYLQSAYPDVTWDWVEKNPERIIAQGGTARIRLYGVADFNYANIVFDSKANINCDMMRIVPLTELQGAADNGAPPPKQQQPSDPQVWYELQGRKVLENLIADLHSRGHSSLTIKDNGEICIKQAGSEVPKQTLKNFPDKNCWQRLVKVFEKEGLAASVTETGIAVSW